MLLPSCQRSEEKTSAFLAKELKSLGYNVTDHIGKYSKPGLTGYGVAAVLKNGEGPTVLIRTDMDALPVVEKTGLPYASTVISRNDDGSEVGVMHACGHDIHMTCFLGTAKMLVELKDQWHGTIVLVGQPAEEIVSGAGAMLNDGFYTHFPKPDFALALHDFPLEAGKVGIYPGYILASAYHSQHYHSGYRRTRIQAGISERSYCSGGPGCIGTSDYCQPGDFAI